MYDAVFVLVEAFNKYLRKRTDKNNMRRVTTSSNQPINGTKPLDCYHNRGWVTPWEHGDKISRLLRKVNKYSISKNNAVTRTTFLELL